MSENGGELLPGDVRVLHLFANYKWTGPADPAIRCAAWLRRLGADVVFARAGWTLPGAEHRMDRELRLARMPVVAGLHLPKHFRMRSLLHDRARLARRIVADDLAVLHSHLPGDHLVAALAKVRSGRQPVLVRTLYDAEAPRRSLRARAAFARTDGVVVPTAEVGEQVRARFALPADRVLLQEPTTDPRAQGPNLRARWGCAPDDVVIGITARIQPHRRFDLLWRTLRAVVDARPQVRLALLGRGNEEDTRTLVHEPVAALGLQRHVVLPGYLYEPDYTAALRGLDVFLFLVPGSDGTCRAVRDAMACGVPVVCTRAGMLPQIVTSGDGTPAGFAVDDGVDALAAALRTLVDDADLRRRTGAAALAKTRTAMDPRAAARRLLAFYRRLSASPRR